MEWTAALWNHEPGGLIPRVPVEAGDVMSGAALALLMFRREGYVFRPDARIEMRPQDVEATKPFLVRDVAKWLTRTVEGQAFARAEELPNLF